MLKEKQAQNDDKKLQVLRDLKQKGDELKQMELEKKEELEKRR